MISEKIALEIIALKIKILHNGNEIKTLAEGFTDEHICIDGFDIPNDLFEIGLFDDDDVRILVLLL